MNTTRRLFTHALLVTLLVLLGVPSVPGQAAPPAPKTLVQLARLNAADGGPGSNFGNRIGISGTTAIVSANAVDSNKGALYVYLQSGLNWNQQARLTAPAPDTNQASFFGTGAIDGDTIAVAAPRVDNSRGAVYIFTRSGTTWTFQQKLIASDATDNMQLGNFVALQGDTLVVTWLGNTISRTGAAYVFIRDTQTGLWSEQARLVPTSDSIFAAGQLFGASAALDGDTLVVNAFNQPPTGAAYVYTRSGVTWTLQTKLTVSDLAAQDDYLGYTIGLSGNRIVLGTYFAGTAYTFTRSGITWTQETKFRPFGPPSAGFGIGVALQANRVIIGDRTCLCLSLFINNGTEWLQQQQLKPLDAGVVDFPIRAAMASNGLVIASNAAFNGNSTQPQVYVFDSKFPGARNDTVGTYRQSDGLWQIRYSNSTGAAELSFLYGGGAGTFPVAGDWNADGIDTVGVYDSTIGRFALRDSNTQGAAQYQFFFGSPGDSPLAGHWSADMSADSVGVYRNSNGILYQRKMLNTGFADFFMILGNPGDRGIAGDWNGDGIDSVGVYRPSDLRFYLSNLNTQGVIFADVTNNFGEAANDTPVAGNFAGFANSGIGIYKTTGQFKLKIEPYTAGAADFDFTYGTGVPSGQYPVFARWIAPSAPPPMVFDPVLQGLIVRGGPGSSKPAPVELSDGSGYEKYD